MGRTFAVLIVAACAETPIPEPAYVGTFGECHAGGEVANVRLYPDGGFHWAHDGCDYMLIGDGAWKATSDGVRLITVSGQNLEYGQTVNAIVADGGIVFFDDTDAGHFWGAGGLCESCSNAPCPRCADPRTF